MNALHHVVHTNAVGSDGRGFRFLYRAPAWMRADRRRIETWLQGLQVEDDATPITTCAVNSLRIGGTIHACLVSADSGFGTDAHGRPARLTHAILTSVDERQPADDWGGALLSWRRSFVRPPLSSSQARLDAYLTRCDALRDGPREALPQPSGETIDFAVTARVHSAAVSASPTLFLAETTDPAALMMRVTARLPPRLRLAFRWRLGLGAAPGVTLLQTPTPSSRLSDTPPAAALDPRATAYARWLEQTGHASLATAWHIRSWDELMAVIAAGESESRARRPPLEVSS